MKSFLLFVVLFAITFNSFAEKIEPSVAEKVAVNFFVEKSNTFNHPVDILDLNIVESVLMNESYYVINFDEGWVIVAADDAMYPVIGYNYSGNFPLGENIDLNFKSWMQSFSEQVEYIKENDLKADNDVAAVWTKYQSDEPSSNKSGERGSVSPLLTAKWNQDSPYNKLCPEDEDGPGGRVYVGCVATAMSLIMHYWRYPNQGSGSHSYFEYPYGTLSANYGQAVYDWDAMHDVIDPKNPWEIAEIGYHAAVAVDMGFSPAGSGAYSWDVPSAMRNYFNFKNTVQYVEKGDYSFSVWEDMIQEQLEDGQPMYYSGYSDEGGHAFVLDGYEGSNFYHFNFGWSGQGNGFYTLQDVNSFSSGQGMVRNIIPDDENYPYIAEGMNTLAHFSGSFTDGSGPVENYPMGMEASWLIDPQTDVDSVSSISLKFIEFNTSSSDMVKIYAGESTDAELLGEYSGNELPEAINYGGNKMLITFSSSGTGEGFKVEYKTTQPTWCSGSDSYSEPHGTITDGSGDFHYSNGATCIYVIQNPSAEKISLEFTMIDTELDKDEIKVYNGNNQLIGEYSGTEIPDVIVEETNTLILVWTSNSTVRGEGWTAEYMIDGVGIEDHLIGDLMVYPNPATDQLNISLEMEKTKSYELRLVNINGQVVYSESQTNFSGRYNNSIDLSQQPKGIYLLSLISEKGKMDKKVVLQ